MQSQKICCSTLNYFYYCHRHVAFLYFERCILSRIRFKDRQRHAMFWKLTIYCTHTLRFLQYYKIPQNKPQRINRKWHLMPNHSLLRCWYINEPIRLSKWSLSVNKPSQLIFNPLKPNKNHQIHLRFLHH